MPSKEKIEGMFDSIAKDYDSLNHVLSLSIDKIWRRKALKKIVDAGETPTVLDVACGTGDFSIAIAAPYFSTSSIGTAFAYFSTDRSAFAAAVIVALLYGITAPAATLPLWSETSAV